MRSHPSKRTALGDGTASSGRPTQGWTLVEMAGVLAVLGLLVGLTAPALQDLSLRVERDAEIRTASRLSEGFRAEVRRRGTMPDASEEMLWMAAGVGLPESQIRFHRPGRQRLILRDPAMNLVPMPQAPTGNGVWSAIGNVRFLLMSSVGEPLSSGDIHPALFQILWDLPPGHRLEGWGWTGRMEDLVMTRIDLSTEFVQVGWSVADGIGATVVFGDGPMIPAGLDQAEGWFLRGTTVSLLDPRGEISIREVIDVPTRYRYSEGRWRRAGIWTPEPTRPTIQDFALLADRFLRMPERSGVEGVSTRELWGSFTRFAGSLAGRFQGDFQGDPVGGLATAHDDLERALRRLLGNF